MFTLLRLLPYRQLFGEQQQAIATARVIAELFYRFHRFSLECAAFLRTWFVLDAALQGLKSLLGKAPDAVQRR